MILKVGPEPEDARPILRLRAIASLPNCGKPGTVRTLLLKSGSMSSDPVPLTSPRRPQVLSDGFPVQEGSAGAASR